MSRFAIIGAAGYIARKHIAVIKQLGHEVTAICDVNDNVGYIEGYFRSALFFKTEKGFFDYITDHADWLVVCTPNDLHMQHCMAGIQAHCRVICEKPLVCSLMEHDALMLYAAQRKAGLYSMLQLRHTILPTVRSVVSPQMTLNYHAPRGRWYRTSWKGQWDRSGGLLWNIGIHPFDLLVAALGKPVEWSIDRHSGESAEGRLEFAESSVRWQISTEQPADRAIIANGAEIPLVPTGDPLHQHLVSYKEILAGNGIGPDSVRPTTQLVEAMSKRLREME